MTAARLPHEKDTTLLVRTDFSDEDTWHALLEIVTDPWVEGSSANLRVLDDPAYRDAPAEQLTADAPEWSMVFIADREALTHPEHPLLVVHTTDEGRERLRVVPRELWSVENNISISNMDWEDFADAVDEDGVFRGF
ncbi:hypothetical protein Q5530_37380 [Saccharothrix sp. BKS2]|uniref:DUF6924 domain-containing protein n=1 Tax=Saccharothrix sp. BKS2 TaxID=3064400 RepID=UPI0039EA965B